MSHQERIKQYLKTIGGGVISEHDASIALEINNINQHSQSAIYYYQAGEALLSMIMYEILYERDYSEYITKKISDISEFSDEFPVPEMLVTVYLLLEVPCYIIYGNEMTHKLVNGIISGRELSKLLGANSSAISGIKIEEVFYFQCNVNENYISSLNDYCVNAIKQMAGDDNFCALDAIVSNFARNNTMHVRSFVTNLLVRNIWFVWQNIIDSIVAAGHKPLNILGDKITFLHKA